MQLPGKMHGFRIVLLKEKTCINVTSFRIIEYSCCV